MQAEELARLLHARKSGNGKWMAKCPAHQDRSPSLSIRLGKDRVLLKCFSGCNKDDILAKVGVTWKNLYYRPFQKIDSRIWANMKRAQKAEELHKSNLRIGELVLRFCEIGYTKEDREADMSCILAAAWVLSRKSIPHWENMYRYHWERILAADHCRERKMLPIVAKQRAKSHQVISCATEKLN